MQLAANSKRQNLEKTSADEAWNKNRSSAVDTCKKSIRREASFFRRSTLTVHVPN